MSEVIADPTEKDVAPKRFAVLVNRNYYPSVMYFDTLEEARAEYELNVNSYAHEERGATPPADGRGTYGFVNVSLVQVTVMEHLSFAILNP